MKDRTYPYKISSRRNEMMDCVDMQIVFGGFDDQKDAEAYAAALVSLISEHLGGTYERFQ